ncbi:NADP-dependent oxidoreductase [Flavitalea sp. BT771]|uniref:NADP-dependent oxidoreductase n=1 Tax=Flavitalea sp. BT771 TaxID=3063329 RepID=UPI0026E254B2|nr:NADP-dependent oxidoreductase [Flavitalea sp. BT771]MDO6430253.1 NADP-dependent oxidoreductase [Flavitalea sp. BT771]MDV6219607.1 NADP-dependent oxidoreductase [Flavitalea sp. BT771]
MKAIQIPHYGGADVLQFVDLGRPVPQDGEVLIQVKAASLNPVDSKIRNGYLKDIIPLPLPLVPGWEAAGVVAESRLKGFNSGDEVVTRVPFQRGGAYAEYMIAGDGEVVLKPRELSFVEAATLPIVAGAAYTLLHKMAQVKAGDRVFLLGAGGSVGLYAVQMAKALGATVIGTATGEDVDILLSLGIDQVVDYTVPGYLDTVRDIDLALDFVGGPSQEALMSVVRKNGLLLSTVNPPNADKAAAAGIRASFAMTNLDRGVMEEVLHLAARGEIKGRIGKVLPLAQAAEAQRLMDERAVGGKIVLA